MIEAGNGHFMEGQTTLNDAAGVKVQHESVYAKMQSCKVIVGVSPS